MPSSDDGEGYRAHSYLGRPLSLPFPLAPEFHRVPPYESGLTAEQQERADGLLHDSLVISLHDHPVRFPADLRDTRLTTGPAASTPRTPDWPQRSLSSSKGLRQAQAAVP